MFFIVFPTTLFVKMHKGGGGGGTDTQPIATLIVFVPMLYFSYRSGQALSITEILHIQTS